MTRTLRRYKLKSYTTVQPPRAHAALVSRWVTGDQWLLEMRVDSIAACEAAVDRLTIAEIERWTTTHKPLQFPKA